MGTQAKESLTTQRGTQGPAAPASLARWVEMENLSPNPQLVGSWFAFKQDPQGNSCAQERFEK